MFKDSEHRTFVLYVPYVISVLLKSMQWIVEFEERFTEKVTVYIVRKVNNV